MAMTDESSDRERIYREVRAEAGYRDRRVKIGLLITSLVTVVLLTVAALHENIFPSWRTHQRNYAGILQQKANDTWGRKIARDYKVEMRQVVLPELGTVDRCVTCHSGIDDPRMTDVPNPYAVHPGKYLEWHDVSRFGCTVCHRGQGRAMTFPEAKAEGFHWDYPLLPKELVQSSCGQCHSQTEVARNGGEVFARGAALFEAKGCRSCHQLYGRGGNLGPALDNEGLKVAGQLPMAHIVGPHTLPQWLREHFDDPQHVVAGSRMPQPGLSRDETTALTTYILSLQERDLPESYLSPERHLEVYAEAHPTPRTGEQLYATFCTTCHDTGTFGRWDKFFKTFVPAIRGETYRRIADPGYVAANIREGRAGTIMPPWGLGAGGLREDEILALTKYLLGREDLTAAEVAPRPVGTWSVAQVHTGEGDAAHGLRLFNKNCSGCHGAAGAGKYAPSLDSPVFLAHADPDFLYATIAGGRRNSAMPAFLTPGGLQNQDLLDLIAYLRTLGAPADARTARAVAPEKGGDHGQP
jgi:mono/diheme cytochrome c family protein